MRGVVAGSGVAAGGASPASSAAATASSGHVEAVDDAQMSVIEEGGFGDGTADTPDVASEHAQRMSPPTSPSGLSGSSGSVGAQTVGTDDADDEYRGASHAQRASLPMMSLGADASEAQTVKKWPEDVRANAFTHVGADDVVVATAQPAVVSMPERVVAASLLVVAGGPCARSNFFGVGVGVTQSDAFAAPIATAFASARITLLLRALILPSTPASSERSF